MIIARANALEASLAGNEHVLIADNLSQVCQFILGQFSLIKIVKKTYRYQPEYAMDWSDIKGQAHAKKAMEIAAYGGHSVLLSGAPGSGKTMLAQRFITLLPELSEIQALECAAIHTIRGPLISYDSWRQPPYRSPHHTASHVALVGGGTPPKPGEISLAHRGVLFLDELPEFDRQTLETLRQPIESGNICISRASQQVEFPARFQLIAAMNPCPCGQWGNPKASCFCSPERINRYLTKLSAPLLERIDMYIHVQGIEDSILIKPSKVECKESLLIRDKAFALRQRQEHRQGCLNAQLTAKQCDLYCALGAPEQAFLSQLLNQLKLSARGFHRLLKVARTIADADDQALIAVEHIQQAMTFKQALNISAVL